MPKVLNDAFIRSAPPGMHWDGSLKGFGLRVGKNRKTFIVLVASGRRKKVGVWPNTKLANARQEAKKLLAEKTLGRTYPRHTAFDDAKDQFLKDCETRNRPRTVSDYRRLLKHFPFGRQSVGDITPRQILRRLEPLAPSEKHHAYATARRFFRYCTQHHLIDRSAMENMAGAVPQAGQARSRVLTEEELRAVYRTARAGDSHFHRIAAILCLTGQRRGEIARLEWPWANLEEMWIELPSHVTKNGRTHRFPISSEVLSILESTPRLSDRYVFRALRQSKETTTVFNGWGKPKARFDQEMRKKGYIIAPYCLHDLRRTLSSFWAAEPFSVPQVVTEKYLNHVSGGSLSPIAQTYNRHLYFEEQRRAAVQWAEYLANLIAQPAPG